MRAPALLWSRFSRINKKQITPRIGDIPLKKLTGRDPRHPHNAAQCARPGSQGTPDCAQSSGRLRTAENSEARNENPAAGADQVLFDRSRPARCPADVLSRTHQRLTQGRAGRAPMVRFGHRKQDDFRQQAGRTQQRRRTGHHTPENGKFNSQNLHPAGCRRSAGRRTPKASRQPMDVPIPENGRDVPSGFDREHS